MCQDKHNLIGEGENKKITTTPNDAELVTHHLPQAQKQPANTRLVTALEEAHILPPSLIYTQF